MDDNTVAKSMSSFMKEPSDREDSVSEQFERVTHALSELDDAFSALGERLVPILKPSNELNKIAREVDPEKFDYESEIQYKLRIIGNRINSLRFMTEECNRRVDI